MEKIRRIAWAGVFAVMMLGGYFLLGELYTKKNEAGGGSPVIRTTADLGGVYNLINQDGQPVNQNTYKGKWQVVFFGFSYCPDICPMELQKITNVMSRLTQEQIARIQPVFISIDPERDTPSQMKAYLKLFHPSIAGLTGTPEQVRQAADSYKVYYEKVQDPAAIQYTMNHSSFVYLMNPGGRLHAIFRHPLDEDALYAELQNGLHGEDPLG